MPIAQRTATSGTAASNATFTVSFPSGVTDGDLLVVVVANALVTSPNAPSGWTKYGPYSAGTNQSVSLYTAPWNLNLGGAGTGQSFTNVTNPGAWACNAYYTEYGNSSTSQGYIVPKVYGTPVATSNSSNNTTMPTGSATTPAYPVGMYEIMAYAWTSAATVSTTASGSTIDKTQANSTTISAALGHNNTASLTPSAATTAFSHTLSASNNRKTGVAMLLQEVLTWPPGLVQGNPSDDFNTDPLDTVSRWSTFGSPPPVQSGGTLSMSAPASPSTGYLGLFATTTRDYSNAYARVEIVQLPSNAVGSQMYLRLEADANNAAIFGFGDNAMFAQKQIAGVTTTTRTSSWPAGTRFLRLGYESSSTGAMFYDYSSDGTNWTQFWWEALATSFGTSNLRVVLGTGTYIALASPGTAIWDNVNYIPPLSYKDLIGTAVGRTISPADTYRTTVLSDNPVAFYRMDETYPGQPGGDILINDSGPNNRWQYYNKGFQTYGITGALSRGDPAVNFNGQSGAYAATPYQPELSGSGPFTVEGWMRVPSWPASDAPLFCMGDVASTDRFLQCTVRNGLPFLGFMNDDYAPTGTSLSVNTWHHLVYVWEGPTTKMQRIYVDGVQFGVGRASTGNLNVTNGGAGTRVASNVPTSITLNGDLDEIAMYSTALSQARITAHFNAASNSPIKLSAKRAFRPPYGINNLDTSRGRAGVSGIPLTTVVMQDSPMLWWRLGEITGTTANDSSGNGRSGTLNTGVLFQANGVLPFDPDGAADFPGTTNAYIQGPFLNIFQGGLPWTIEFWVNPSNVWNPGASYPLFHCGDAQATDRWVTCDTSGPIPELRFYNDDTTGGAPFLYPGRHHFVYQYEGNATKVQRIYVDGVQWDNHVATANPNVTVGSQTGNGFRVGAGHFQGGAFNGRIDEVAVYPTFLSLARVQAHYNAGWNNAPAPGISRKRSIPVVLSAGKAIVTGPTILKRPSLFGAAVGVASCVAALIPTSGPKNIVGASNGVATEVGQPTIRRSILANSVGVATVVGQIVRRRSLVVLSAGTAVEIGQPSAKRLLVGSTAGKAIATGAVYKGLTGNAVCVATVTAVITRRRSMVVASNGAATEVGQPTAIRLLAATSNGVAVASGQTVRRKSMVVAAVGVAFVTGQVIRRVRILGASVGAATAIVSLTTRSATIPPVIAIGRATVFAIIGRKRQMVVASVGTTAVTAILTRRRALVANSVGVAATTGVMSHKITLILSGAVGIAVTNTATIQRKRNLVALAVGVAITAKPDVLKKVALAGSSDGQTFISRPTLTRVRRLVGTTIGRATVHGRPINVGLILWNGSTFTMVGNYPVVLWDQAEFELQVEEGESIDYVAYKGSTDQFNPIEP